MRSRTIVAALLCLAGVSAQAQEKRVDVRTIRCFEVVAADQEDRIAASFFLYGMHAALRNIWVVPPEILVQKAQKIIEICTANPDMTAFDATPKAFQE